MPYKRNKDLPSSVKDSLPAGAQTIYRKAFNNASEQYEDPENRRDGQSLEETAHRVAWSAVKTTYEKNNSGKWVKKPD
jgi:cation transport regulator